MTTHQYVQDNERLKHAILDTSWFQFEEIDLRSEECRKLLNLEYTKKEIAKSRRQSMLHFLHFSCTCSNYRDRRSIPFIVHVIEIFNQQRGRCCISGQPLQRPTSNCCDRRFFVSIDRIDNYSGYEIGNIRLTLQWMNHALGKKMKSEEMIEFSALICLEKVFLNPDFFLCKYFDETYRNSGNLRCS
jgi:hypothetical protein